MKTCSKCGETKDDSEFYKRHTKCKQCTAEHTKKYQAENREKLKVHQKKYRAGNREKISGYDKKYRAENWENISEYQKKYQAENREKISSHKKKYQTNYRLGVGYGYCARLLGVKASEVPKELLEVKRMNLLIKRHIKENSK